MDPSLMVWMIRIQETETLLQKRKAELQAQRQKRAQLQHELGKEETRQDEARQQLASVHEASHGLTYNQLQLKQDIKAARATLTEQQSIAGLAAQQRMLLQQLERLKAMTELELHIQDQYADTVKSYMHDQGSRGRDLRAKADKVEAKLTQLQQHAQQLDLSSKLVQLNQQQEQLQADIAQMQAQLTAKKQANMLARAQAAAAVSTTGTELKAAEDRCAALKTEAFQLGRQHTVNATRLRQLHQEGDSLNHQCCYLDKLIADATATIEELTSSCDV